MSFEMDSFRLDGKVAFVTGAVYGIGFAIAEALAAAGATIVFNGLNDADVQKGLDSYKEKGIEAHGYVFLIRDRSRKPLPRTERDGSHKPG